MKTTLIPLIILLLATSSLPAQGVWKQKAAFGGGLRGNAVGFSIGDKGYAGTGAGSSSIDFWEYNPATNAWTQKADFAGAARSSATGFSIGNKGYIGTGYAIAGNLLNDFWEYDPVANTWTQKASFAGGVRAFANGFSIGSKGYIGAGRDEQDLKNDFWEYSPAADTWVQKADYAGGPAILATGFSIGTKGYIGLGIQRGQDFWEYDPVLNSWSRKADFPGPPRYFGAGFSIGDKGYIGTGILPPANEYFNDCWEYNPASNSWTQKAFFGGTGRNAAVSFSIGDKGYLGTGYSSSGNTNDFWEFSPNAVAEQKFPAVRFDPISVSTWVGDSVHGDANGIGRAARFNTPAGITADDAGNIYVVDSWNHQIRKINKEGAVSTLAGGGIPGYADGEGSSARFSYPSQIAHDKAGNLYVGDRGNNALRKVTPAGIVTTIVPSNGWGDGRRPDGNGIAVDNDGNIMVVDGVNNVILKVTQQGIVSVFAGNGNFGETDGPANTAEFMQPSGIAFNHGGDLFVATVYGELRKISRSGIVSTLHVTGLSKPYASMTVDASDNVYLAGTYIEPGVPIDAFSAQYIYKITPSLQLSLIAGIQKGNVDSIGADAKFSNFNSITVDAFNNLYVTEAAQSWGTEFGNWVRKLSKPTLKFVSKTGSPSVARYFQISGNDLSGAPWITAPFGFEISLSETGPWSTLIGLSANLRGNEMSGVKIYVRLQGNIGAGNYSDSVILYANGATAKAAVSGVVKEKDMKLVIIGSGTSACIGPNPVTDCYVNRLSNYYNQQAMADTIIDNQLARGGTNCYNGMPSSYISPYPPGSGYVPLKDINITAALALDPGVILVNYPGNAYEVLSIPEIMYCLRTIKDSANAKGVPCFITTTQPRTSPSIFNTPAMKLKLAVLKDSILAAFGDYAIDFYNGLINYADSSILYDPGDHINMNGDGHNILFQRVIARNVFNSVPAPATGIGLMATYFNNSTLTAPSVLGRIDPVINNDFVFKSPAPGKVNIENYSVRWTGRVKPLFSENYTFYTVTDDGVRLWVNGVLLIDNWQNQSATEKSGSITLEAGQLYDIEMEYFQGTGFAVSKLLWSSASTSKAVIPSAQLYPPLSDGTGLQGVYYNNPVLAAPAALTRIDPIVNNDFVFRSPAPGTVNVENYSVRWTGQVKPQYSQEYTFYAVTDDGVRLWVNGVLLIDNWHNQSATEKSGSIVLEAGQRYNIIMEYFQGTGFAVSKLLWSSASTAKSIVPKSRLFPTLAGARVIEAAADLHTAPVQELAAISTNMHPNPVKPGQLVSLQMTSSNTTTAVIRLVASDGATVRTEQRHLVAGVNAITLSTGKLAQGVYIINVTGAGKPVNLKLMVE